MRTRIDKHPDPPSQEGITAGCRDGRSSSSAVSCCCCMLDDTGCGRYIQILLLEVCETRVDILTLGSLLPRIFVGSRVVVGLGSREVIFAII